MLFIPRLLRCLNHSRVEDRGALSQAAQTIARAVREASDSDTHTATYAVLRSEISLRIGQQSKCVELSVLFTGAVMGALFGMQYARLAHWEPHLLLGAISFVYCLAQEALLANYIYQTWLILGLDAYILEASGPSVLQVGLFPGGWEGERNRVMLGNSPRLVKWFQPGILYLSSAAGLSVLVYSSLRCWHSIPRAQWVVMDILSALVGLLLLLMLRTHLGVSRKGIR